MLISNDDAIWRYQPRLIDLRGWTVVGQPRYVVLAVSGVTALVTGLPLLILLGPLTGGAATLALAFLAGFLMSPYFTSERPLVAWLATARGEARSWGSWLACQWRSRLARPTRRRVPPPLRVSPYSVRRSRSWSPRHQRPRP